MIVTNTTLINENEDWTDTGLLLWVVSSAVGICLLVLVKCVWSILRNKINWSGLDVIEDIVTCTFSDSINDIELTTINQVNETLQMDDVPNTTEPPQLQTQMAETQTKTHSQVPPQTEIQSHAEIYTQTEACTQTEAQTEVQFHPMPPPRQCEVKMAKIRPLPFYMYPELIEEVEDMEVQVCNEVLI